MLIRIRRMLLTFAMLSLSLQAASADQLCRSVDIKFRNDVPRSIKILKFEYYDVEDAKWRTENVGNFFQIQGATSGKMDESLEYVGNERISKFRVHYKWCGVQNANGQCSGWQKGSYTSVATPGIPDVTKCIKNLDVTIPVIHP